MKTITNLSDAKELAIGEDFLFGRYAQYPIEWIKVTEDSAIATCVLEKMAFGNEYDYEISRIRIWCNELAEKTGIEKDTIYIPTDELLMKWFATDDERKCNYSKSLEEREYVGRASYWTAPEAADGDYFGTFVNYLGKFERAIISNSYIGVRPTMKLN